MIDITKIKAILNLKGYGSIRIDIAGTKCTIEASSEGIGLTFALLKALSEELGTDEISEYRYNVSGGCESCDCGAYDEITLTATNCKNLM